MSIQGTCHCGAIAYEFKDQPEWATECNCSICRRLGVHWIYTKTGNIVITAEPNSTLRYVHGDKTIAFHTCNVCGCTTHWENIDGDENSKMAVNLKLAEPSIADTVPVRRFDGAQTWKFLD